MRSWWGTIAVDGRKNTIKFGPQAKDGGFHLRLYQRDKGRSVPVLEVMGFTDKDDLFLEVKAQEGIVYTRTTKR